MNQQTVWYRFFVVVGLVVLLAGCGGGAASSGASSTTDLLTQSGFTAEPVKHPSHLQKLPGNQFVSVQGQGFRSYVYSDPVTKQLYIGSEAAHMRYRAKAAAAGVPEAQQSSQHSMSSHDWSMYASLHGVGP